MPPSGLERTALSYVPGTGGVTVERLASGLVNESYRVRRGGQLYSMRVPAPDATVLGVDRDWECRVLARAASEGLAPWVECCEPRAGILVTRWVQGGTWTPEQARLGPNLERIARLLRRVHALPSPGVPRIMSPSDWIDYYQGALALCRPDPMSPMRSAPARQLRALAALPPAEPVLCHSDLHIQNLVEAGQGLVLLDWEYAHVSEASWDLAAWVCNNDLSADSCRFLLDCYLGRPPRPEEEARLQHYKWLYDYVCLLWNALYRSSRVASMEGDALASRTAFLTARLRL